jgi:hypothetical protein
MRPQQTECEPLILTPEATANLRIIAELVAVPG